MFLWNIAVTSLAEVWIEIILNSQHDRRSQSLPLRKCGLKFCGSLGRSLLGLSLPLRKCGLKFLENPAQVFSASSLPLRKCGLKYPVFNPQDQVLRSLPLRKCGLKSCPGSRIFRKYRHFPCGSVD